MNVICCQLDLVWENSTANYKRAASLLAGAKIEAGSLIVLPEMFPSGFSMNVPAVAEGTPSETGRFFTEVARQYRSFVVGGLVTLGPDKKGRNQSVIVGPDGTEVGRYSKIQPFSLGGEATHYTAGNEVLVGRCGDFVLSPFICYDLRFPEIFRTAVCRGAEVFTVIASWPIRRAQHWVTLLQARAIENQAYVIGVNRCGTDPQFVYPGRSLIINPMGEILADAGEGEGLATASIDHSGLLKWRNDFPALRDMRPEFTLRSASSGLDFMVSDPPYV